MITATNNFYVELIEQPHLLVAGSTGSGKSVVINGILNQITVNNSGRYILIDPKKVELNGWKKSPCCMAYADDLTDIAKTIRSTCGLMDKRYKLMQRHNLKKIENSAVYIVIDEYIDITPQVERNKQLKALKQQIDSDLIRLLSLGRASGLHVILATQTPRARILTDIIRANLTSRVALRTNTALESRILMDRNGCELLPLYGQGYLITPTKTELWEIPYINERYIKNAQLLRRWKK